jgi:hypothetical protein
MAYRAETDQTVTEAPDIPRTVTETCIETLRTTPKPDYLQYLGKTILVPQTAHLFVQYLVHAHNKTVLLEEENRRERQHIARLIQEHHLLEEDHLNITGQNRSLRTSLQRLSQSHKARERLNEELNLTRAGLPEATSMRPQITGMLQTARQTLETTERNLVTDPFNVRQTGHPVVYGPLSAPTTQERREPKDVPEKIKGAARRKKRKSAEEAMQQQQQIQVNNIDRDTMWALNTPRNTSTPKATVSPRDRCDQK